MKKITLIFSLVLLGILIALGALAFAYERHWIFPSSMRVKYDNVGKCNPLKLSTPLGVQLVANCQSHIVAKYGNNKTSFDIISRHNRYGWREVPGSKEFSSKATLFWGCSYTYGWGVNDEETLPARYAALAPGRAVWNFGVSGTGPQQVLQILKSGDLIPSELSSAKEVVGIYNFIPLHLDRVYGSYFYACTQGANFARYGIGMHGELRENGLLRDSCPVPYWLSKRLNNFKLYARIFGLPMLTKWPPPKESYDITAAILYESHQNFLRRFPKGKFYVVFYPTAYSDVNGPLLSRLKDLKIQYFDYGNLVDWRKPGVEIPGDGHPTPLVHAMVAKLLVRDLHRARSNQ